LPSCPLAGLPGVLNRLYRARDGGKTLTPSRSPIVHLTSSPSVSLRDGRSLGCRAEPQRDPVSRDFPRREAG
jgi:hypothetical protein